MEKGVILWKQIATYINQSYGHVSSRKVFFYHSFMIELYKSQVETICICTGIYDESDPTLSFFVASVIICTNGYWFENWKQPVITLTP